MKNLMWGLLFLPTILQAQYADNHVSAAGFEPNTNPAAHFAGDVVYNPTLNSATEISDMAIAPNGFIYIACAGTDTIAATTRLTLYRSMDDGFSFQSVFSYPFSGTGIFRDLSICIGGQDSASFRIFVGGINVVTNAVFINSFDANGGNLAAPFIHNSTGTLKDMVLVTDNGVPSVVTTGNYSVSIAFVESQISADYLLYATSLDNGVTFQPRDTVHSTGNYIRSVDMAYASQPNYYNGRNYITWWQSGTSNAPYGSLYVTNTISDIGSGFYPAFRLDTIGNSSLLIGYARNPHVAAARDLANDNVSLGLSVSVVFERPFGGDLLDQDILAFDHLEGPADQNWLRHDILNSGAQVYSPDVVYDSLNNLFRYVYYDSTLQEFTYLSTGFDLNGTYTSLNTNFEDANPLVAPEVAMAARSDGQCAFIWKHSAVQHRFDAEFLINTVSVENAEILLGELITYPNPATELMHIGVQLPQEQEIWFEVRSVTGTVVSSWNGGILPAGETVITYPCAELSNGLYVLVMQGKSGQVSRNFLVSR